MTSNSAVDQLGVNKSWELSLYELHRTPQEAVTDDTEIAVSPRSLHNELMCPICLDMLKKTMTTKECLHRFCSDCIVTALRSGNKECPTCRKKLVSKRSLRPDPNFDLLISKIYPSRDEYEAHQSKAMEKFNKSHSQAALMQSISEGIKFQNQIRLQKATKKPQTDNENNPPTESAASESNQNGSQLVNNNNTVSTSSTKHSTPAINSPNDNVPGTSNINTNTSNVIKPECFESADSVTESGSMSEDSWCGPVSSDEIELVFKPHPNENTEEFTKSLREGPVRYLKTTANATMNHLCKYLETRASIDRGSSQMTFSIHVAPTADNFVGLNEAESLRNVVDKYWRSNKPLELYYVSKKTKKEK